MATATTRTIKAAEVIGRGELLNTSATFYLVASRTCEGVNYLVSWSEARAAWVCNCPAARHGRMCSHVNAVNEHVFNERMAAVSASQARVRASLDRMERRQSHELSAAETRDLERQWSMCGSYIETRW